MRGHLVQRNKGSWTYQITIGRDPVTNKRLRKTGTIHGTKGYAEEVLNEMLAEFQRGVLPVDDRQTVGQWLEFWLTDVVKSRVRRSTWESYRSYVRGRIIPAVGHLRLQRLAPVDIDRLMTSMRADGLSENTIRHVHVILGKALRDAEQRGMVSRNVARLVDPPKVERKQIPTPNMDQVSAVCGAAGECGPVFRIMARTGLRRSEVAALRWGNVDLTASVPFLNVVEAVDRVSSKKILVLEPKSMKSRRQVALDPVAVDLLRDHRVKQNEHVMALAQGLWTDNDLVFPNSFGSLIDPDLLTRGFRKAARQAGLRGFTLHSLRHHHTTELVRAGVNLKTVQDRLGHATAAFTLDVYTHSTAQDQAEAAKAYESAEANST